MEENGGRFYRRLLSTGKLINGGKKRESRSRKDRIKQKIMDFLQKQKESRKNMYKKCFVKVENGERCYRRIFSTKKLVTGGGKTRKKQNIKKIQI